MHLHLIRYHQSPALTQSRLHIDGVPFCEAREPGTLTFGRHRLAPLPAGEYRCRCVATEFSPMTLQVCRTAGHRRLLFGFHPMKQWQANVVNLGLSDPTLPPEQRTLVHTSDTFDRFTQRVYAAYARGESFTLTVSG